MDGVLVEVAFEKPFAGVDVFAGADAAEAGLSGGGPEAVDAVDHEELWFGQARRVGEEFWGLGGEVDEEVVGCVEPGVVFGCGGQAGLFGERGGGEKAEGCVHGVDGLVVHGHFDGEALDDHAGGDGRGGEGDVGFEGAGGAGDFGEEFAGAV